MTEMIYNHPKLDGYVHPTLEELKVIHIWKVLVIKFWMTSYYHQTIHYWMIHVLHFLMIYSSEGLIHYWKILDICCLDVCIVIRN